MLCLKVTNLFSGWSWAKLVVNNTCVWLKVILENAISNSNGIILLLKLGIKTSASCSVLLQRSIHFEKSHIFICMKLKLSYTSDSQYGVRSTVKLYDSVIPFDMLTVTTRWNKFPTDVLDDTNHRFNRRGMTTIPAREATRLSDKVKLTVRVLEKVCQLLDLDVRYSKTCRTLLTGIEPSPYATVQVAMTRQILIYNHT
jgi:hypothetical protein